MRAYHAVMANHWAILPQALDMIVDVARRENEGPEAVAKKLGRPLDNSYVTTVRDRTAILPLTGPIFPRANMMTALSGATSLSVFSNELHRAVENDSIDSILIDVDSPGGVAFGPAEMADMIARAKEIKPVIAYVSGMCASAAYWIAAACTEIVAHRTAQIGSIGVVTAMDVQEQVGQDGYKTYQIVSSNAPNKRPDPRTEEGMSEIRRELDDLEAQFIQSVADHRGVSIETVKSDFGAGGLLIAADAVRVGMADRTGSFEDVLSELNPTNPHHRKSGGAMNTQANANPAAKDSGTEITAASIRTDHPAVAEELTAAAQKEGYNEGLKAGAAAERQRITEIDALAMDGHEDLIASAKADPTMTAEKVAVQMVKSEKGRGASYIKEVETASNKLPTIDAGVDKPAEQSIDASAPLEDRAKAKWNKDASVRAEFGDNFGAFLAFEKNAEAGNIKILNK